MGCGFIYGKNNPDMYQLLKKWGSQEQAIIRAEKLQQGRTDENFADHNPSTLVYLLVKALMNLETPM